ncbi:hypothetical protein LOTGIDRAFT_232607 [Lottia gigantea]|uniref:Luciferin 4-monooxygenase n=1 Tax=Lottia gigantea TaxID=225164 RepID=V3ZQ69_LOTGI|nr:hypothetical protein LOTGIDRAFT_232607 [Lottia gigantea]ESO93533.1 hypothetical protein LOTGIDRAFT_232607 [Lottia gigantea]
MKRSSAERLLTWCKTSSNQITHHPRCRFPHINNQVRQQSVWSKENIVRSPIANADIPNVSFSEYIFSRCDEFKDNTAVIDFESGRNYSYTVMKGAAIKVASALTRLGYKKGDVIAVYSANVPEYSIIMLAASSIGVIVTPANPSYTPGELAIQLEHSKAKAAFTILPLLPNLKEAINSKQSLASSVKEIFILGEAEGCRPVSELLKDDGTMFPDVSIDPKNDILILPYSSGTTGLPKGVMLTHHNCIANLYQVKLAVDIKQGVDRFLGILPFYHIYGMIPVQFGAIDNGCPLITLPKFDPPVFLRALQEQKISILHAVPPILLFMAKHPSVSKECVQNLKYIVSGAAPLGVGLSKEFTERHELPIYQGYGLTETSPVIAIDNPPAKLGSNGPVVCNSTAKVKDVETGRSLGPGEEGEICIKGPQVMKGYLNNQQATNDMIDSDGWLHTGDIGYFCEEGNLVIEDRLKELIKYKGFQVPPAELEAILLTHPSVQDAAVIGVQDAGTGELPKAFIVRKPNTDVQEDGILKFVEEKVAQHKRLRGGVEFIDVIPKSPSGKILRRQLRE